MSTTFEIVWNRREKWSAETFGPQTPDKAVGCLEHLQEETLEALEAPGDLEELCDCLLLIMGAAAAHGFTPQQMLEKALWKVEVCEGRTWERVPGKSYRKHTDSRNYSEIHIKKLKELEYLRGQASMAVSLMDIGVWVKKADEDAGVDLVGGEWSSFVRGRPELVALLREAGVEV